MTLGVLDEIEYAMGFLPDPNLYDGGNMVTFNLSCKNKDDKDIEVEAIVYIEEYLDVDAIKLLPRGSSPIYKKRWVKFMLYEVGSEWYKDLFFFIKPTYWELTPAIDLSDDDLRKIKEAIVEKYCK